MMKRIAIIAAGLLALFLAWQNRPVWLTSKERTVVNLLTEKMQTQCVGRYLIDVPSEVKSFARTRIEDVSVEATPMSLDEFQHVMAARESELRATRHVDGYQYLYEAGNGPVPNTQYFIRLKYPSGSDLSRIIEAYKWSADFQIKLQVEGTNSVDSAYMKEVAGTIYDIPVERRENDVPAKKALIFDMLSRLEGREASTIPMQPGVCFPGGFLAGKARDKEDVFTQFVLNAHHDVAFNLQTDTSIQEPDTLLDRGNAVQTLLRNVGGRSIRKGNVDLAGWTVQEWLVSGKNILGVNSNFMTLEANSKVGSPETPLVVLDMKTGLPNNVLQERVDSASLSEAEAVTLWDAISRTLRPRPNGF